MIIRRSGFTLIELLVVIAIISILAAILFPVFSQAREKARQTSCLSNIKQLSLGLLMYAQDYDDKLPTYFWSEGDAGIPNSTTWWGGIEPYVRNTQIYACPSSALPGHHTFQVWIDNTPGFANAPNLSINYGYNELIGNVAGGMKMARLNADVANTVLLADCTSTWIGGYWSLSFPARAKLYRVAYADGDFPCGCPPADPAAQGRAVHNGGSNLGFADGHAKWVNSEQVVTVSGGGSLRYFDNEW